MNPAAVWLRLQLSAGQPNRQSGKQRAKKNATRSLFFRTDFVVAHFQVWRRERRLTHQLARPTAFVG